MPRGSKFLRPKISINEREVTPILSHDYVDSSDGMTNYPQRPGGPIKPYSGLAVTPTDAITTLSDTIIVSTLAQPTRITDQFNRLLLDIENLMIVDEASYIKGRIVSIIDNGVVVDKTTLLHKSASRKLLRKNKAKAQRRARAVTRQHRK